jgi:hypothetical protein
MKRRDINLAYIENFCEIAREMHPDFDFHIDVMVAYLRAPRDKDFSPTGELDRAKEANVEYQKWTGVVFNSNPGPLCSLAACSQ